MVMLPPVVLESPFECCLFPNLPQTFLTLFIIGMWMMVWWSCVVPNFKIQLIFVELWSICPRLFHLWFSNQNNFTAKSRSSLRGGSHIKRVCQILRQLMGHASASFFFHCLKCRYSVTVYVLIWWGFVCNASVSPAMDKNWFSPTDGGSRAS